MEYIYDVFISYRQKQPDQGWVKTTLVPELERQGLKVFIDYRNFKLGASLISEMERGVLSSKYTIAILTPAYLESTFTEFENLISEHLGLSNKEIRLICLMREKCNPRLGINSKLWLDVSSDLLYNDNIYRLVEQLKQQ